MSSILKLLAAIAGVVGAVFTYLSSPNRQRRSAESDVEKNESEARKRSKKVDELVYSGDEEALNALLKGASAILVCVMTLGCVTETKVERVASDEYVRALKPGEVHTNATEEVEWIVPPRKMSELVKSALKVKDLEQEVKALERIK